jgi:hypothetical protein
MTTPQPDAVRSRRRAPRALVALVVLATATWVAVLVLADLPTTDAAGRSVLYFWQRTSGWWQGVLTVAASLLTVALAAWLPVVVVSRWVPRRWRALTASVAAALVLVLAGWLAVLSFLSLALGGAEGTHTVVTGADGRRVLVTRDGFDGDVVAVWQPTGSFTWVREPTATTVDPTSGRCHLEPSPATALLVCGATSQPLDPPPAS